MINLGNDTVNKIYLGNDEVNKIYLGDVEVYNSATPPPPTPYENMYLTFEIIGDGEIGWGCDGSVIEYRINGGPWVSLTGGGFPPVWVSVVSGDTVEFRGNNSKYDCSNGGFGYIADWSSYKFHPTATFNVYGNIMSLIYGDNFSGQTSFPSGTDNNFNSLFASPPFASTPFNTLISAEHFVLPVTTLTSSCYSNMFSYCISLTTAPELPATTLAQSCYQSMFKNCAGLTTATELPATTLSEGCYKEMFNGCNNLNYIKCLATDISASNCTTNWLYNVAASGTFVKNPNMSSWTTGNNGIPLGWTVQDA